MRKKYHGKTIKAILREIKKDRKGSATYRTIAEKYGVSIGSISAWVREYKAEKVRRKKERKPGRPTALSDLASEVLIVAAKISRYDTKRLLSLLSPFFTMFQEQGDKRESVSLRTVQRALDEAGVGKGYQTKREWPPGTMVLHAIPLTWRQAGEQEPRRDQLLCIAERSTGFAYFHAIPQIKTESLYKHIDEFLYRYQSEIVQVILATEEFCAGNAETKRQATAIEVDHEKLRGQLIEDRTEGSDVVKILSGKATRRRQKALPIPGEYSDRNALNETLRKAADSFNQAQRLPVLNSDKECCDSSSSPLDRLWQKVQGRKKRDTFVRRAKFSHSMRRKGRSW